MTTVDYRTRRCHGDVPSRKDGRCPNGARDGSILCARCAETHYTDCWVCGERVEVVEGRTTCECSVRVGWPVASVGMGPKATGGQRPAGRLAGGPAAEPAPIPTDDLCGHGCGTRLETPNGTCPGCGGRQEP